MPQRKNLTASAPSNDVAVMSGLPNDDYRAIAEMHMYRRPQGSDSEMAFIQRFIVPLGVEVDGFGNHYKVVGDANPTVLWSSHTDSVHRGPGMQNISYDSVRHEIFLPKNTKSSCLGADCAAGVWVMAEMIKAGVPGLYVFHREEESGHRGASYIVQEGKLTDGIQAAIAFDRKGKGSIITHMSGGRTCSDAFGKSVAAQLQGYDLDEHGMWTDTYAYRHAVPECSNLSVGYEHAHSKNECLSLKHLVKLRDQMVKFDVTKLVIARDPKVRETFRSTFGGSRQRSLFDSFGEPQTIRDLIVERPAAVALLLEMSGVTFEGLRAAIKLQSIGFTKGMVKQAATAVAGMGVLGEALDTIAAEPSGLNEPTHDGPVPNDDDWEEEDRLPLAS